MCKFNKQICIALTLCSLLASFGCSNKTEQTNNSNPAQDTSITISTDETTVAKPIEKADVPEKDYNEYTFNILTPEVIRPWNVQHSIEQTGELINDAIYIRNKIVEEKFNINIIQIQSKTFQQTAEKSIMAGDTAFDALIGNMDQTANLARKGLLMDFYKVPYINLNKPYWDKNLTEQLSILGKLYFQNGDITIQDDVRTACIIFNKGLWKDHNLPDPYQIVKDGKWTIDKFIEFAANVTKDINGDTILDQYDLWGIMSEYANGGDMFFASEERITKINSDGIPELCFAGERALNVINKTLEVSLNKDAFFLANKIKDTGDIWQEASKIFQQDRVLMRTSVFETVPRDLRSMGTDFGVLPYPKYDESQKNYHTLTRNDGHVVSIPVGADAERSGIIVESLAAESVTTLTAAFYEKSLNGKVIRDNESSDMLDIIFSNKVYDIGYTFGIAGFNSLIDSMIQNNQTNFISNYEKKAKTAQSDLDKILKSFSEVE